MVISGQKIIQMIDGDENGNINFNNIQKFLHSVGLMPYDSEIINFLRRIDRDDDGVITSEELDCFLDKFTPFQVESPERLIYRGSHLQNHHMSPLNRNVLHKADQVTSTTTRYTTHLREQQMSVHQNSV